MGLELSGGEINSFSSFFFFFFFFDTILTIFNKNIILFLKGNLVARKAVKNKYVAYLK